MSENNLTFKVSDLTFGKKYLNKRVKHGKTIVFDMGNKYFNLKD